MNIHTRSGSKVAVFEADEVSIQSAQDALDLLPLLWDEADCRKLALHSASLSADFFDLKTGLAGEVLQKFTNYRIQVAIMGDFSWISSRSMLDFIHECNKGSGVLFVADLTEALGKLHSI